jgi:hypothetical protein
MPVTAAEPHRPPLVVTAAEVKRAVMAAVEVIQAEVAAAVL